MLTDRFGNLGVGVFALLCAAHSAVAAAPLGATEARPAWVTRGAATVTHETGRALYGVGAAAVSADNRDLRQRAEHAAREEVMRQVDAFAAAIQADGSPQGRAVAVSVQALRPRLAQLIRPMDQYVTADGTHYALVAIQANSLWAVVEKARAKGLIRESLDAAALEPLFDKVAHVDAPSSTIAGDAESAWSDTVPKQNIDKVSRALGPEPAWLKSGVSASLPSSVYLCGRGQATSPAAAIGAGHTALMRVLLPQAEQAATALQHALGPIGLAAIHSGDASAAAKAAWATVQPLVVGEQIWVDKKGRVFAATCVGRVKGYIALKERLKIYDSQVTAGATAAAAEPAGSDKKKEALEQAFKILQERTAATAMLRCLNVSGLGQAGPNSLSNLAAAANPVPQAPRLAVAADGPYWLGFANALVDGTRSHGVQPALVAVLPQHDLRLTATLAFPAADSSKKPLKNARGEYVATGTVTLQLQDMRVGTTLLKKTFTATGTAENHVFDAERAAVKQLSQVSVQAMVQVLAHN